MYMSAADRESMYGMDNFYTVVDEDGYEYGTYPSETQAESRIEDLYRYHDKDTLFSIVMD